MRRMIQTLGFGQKTGLDLPGEERGIYRPRAPWTRRTLPSVSIGYEISVTAVQLLQAVNIIANRGVNIPPHIVMHVQKSQDLIPPGGFSTERVLSEETCLRLTTILERSVEEGTGSGAKVTGFPTAGKTGTAQKFDRARGQYVQDRHLASFVGFVPADNPVLSMIVVIDEPRGSYYGGEVAAPVFRAVAEQILRYLKVPPRLPPSRAVVAAQLMSGGTE